MLEAKTRSRRLLVRLSEAEHLRLRERAMLTGHPMGRILRDAFLTESQADGRLPSIATLVAIEQVLLFLGHFFPDGDESISQRRGPALGAALARLDELSAELGARS